MTKPQTRSQDQRSSLHHHHVGVHSAEQAPPQFVIARRSRDPMHVAHTHVFPYTVKKIAVPRERSGSGRCEDVHAFPDEAINSPGVEAVPCAIHEGHHFARPRPGVDLLAAFLGKGFRCFDLAARFAQLQVRDRRLA